MKDGRTKVWLLGVAAVALATLGMVALAQEPPEPPEAPEPPDTMEFFVMGGPSWLGVTLSDVSADKVKEFKLAGEWGALIENVSEDSPAAKAGLQKGDVIVSFGGERVRSVTQLTRLVRETPAGRAVAVEIVRAGKTQTVEVTPETRRARWATPDIHISPMPEMAPKAMPNFNIEVFPGSRPRLGISADEISGQLAEYFGVKQGVLVREVAEGSAAAKAGIKAGDVITRINNEAVVDVEDLRRALSQSEKDATVTFVRERREQTVKVELEQPPARRSPRRSAQVLEFDSEGLQRYADELAQQAERYAAEMEAQVRAYIDSGARVQIEKQLKDVEKQVKEKMKSDEFQKQMKDLKRKMKEIESRLQTI